MSKHAALDQFTKAAPVSVDRIDAFIELPRPQQIEVLAALRVRSVEDNLDLALFAIILPIFVSLALGFIDIKPLPGPPWVAGVALAIGGLVVALPLLAIIGVPLIRRDLRRRNSIAWLAAYEDGLARLRSMSGARARRWRKTH